MKLLQLITCMVFCLFICNKSIAQNTGSNEKPAQSLGQYWCVMYSKGPNWGLDSAATRKKLDQAHVNYIISLRKTGKIITGGAFTDKATWLGMEIYKCETKEEAIKMTEVDPLILQKIFAYEIHPLLTIKGVVTFD